MNYKEKTIAAFLEVWENKPELFQNSGAIDGLKQLQNDLTQESNSSVEQSFQIINDFCGEYEELTDAVCAATKKIKGKHNVSTQETHSLHNHYPKISPSLRERLPKTGEGKPNE